jgi:Zn-dependent M32 family carboxypeptidase
MAKIYYKKILSGDMSIDDVPERWKEEVQKLLDGDEK